jgi:hypothetical protein
VLLVRTGRTGGTKQPPGKSAQCLKLARRIWRTNANFLLATDPEMCYNIPVKISTATATPEKPGSIIYPAVITTLRLHALLMQTMWISLVQMVISLV